MHAAEIVLLLVALGTAVATFAHRWRLPAPPVLVLAGLAVALIPGVPALHVPPHAIAVIVLPPLLYASAEELSPRDLKTVWRPLTVLALGLVLASAAAVGFLAVWLTGLPPAMAFVLGAVLASTDPVAVAALGRRLALPGRVHVLVQGESLFNDASSLVLFKVAVGAAVAAGGTVSVPAAAWRFVLLGGGGALVGAAVAGVAWLIRRRSADPVLGTVIALVTPYAAYVLGENAHTSGVTAVVVAGVLLGRAGRHVSDAHIRLQVHAVYAVVVFLLESVVFAIVGLELPTFVRDLPAGSGWWPLQALALTAAILAMRALWTLPTSRAVTRGGRTSWRVAGVLTWAGTRGVMPLAAALSIPLTADSGEALDGRPLVMVLTTAVVVLTLVVQGLSLAAVVGRSGLAVQPEHTADEEAGARATLDRAALTHLAHLAGTEAAPDGALARAHDHHTARLDNPATPETADPDADYRALRRDILTLQRDELRRLYDTHAISDTTRRRLQLDLDREESALGRE